MKRNELQHLTYGQMRDLIEKNDSSQVSGYISDNIAIMKGSPFELLTHLSSGPFRFDEMRILVAGEGEAHPIVNLRQYDVHAGDLMFVSGGSVAQMAEASPDVTAKGMSCTNELLALAFDGRLPSILNRPRLAFVVHLEYEQRQFLETLHSLLWQAVHEAGMSPQVTLRLVSTILTYIDYLYSRQEKLQADRKSHEEEIFDKFLVLVNQYGATKHQLPFYADRLFLSQRYLGTIVKRVSGVTAKEWIDREIITTIKVDLRHTDKSLKQIADEMDFPNMSFFGTYFKRMTGLTPLQYRNGEEPPLPS